MEMQAVHAPSWSFWSLFWNADWIVKGVIISLILASVVSWAVMLNKWKILREAMAEVGSMRENFCDASMDKADGRFASGGVAHHMLGVANHEWRTIRSQGSLEQKQWGIQRLEQLLVMCIDDEKEYLKSHMTVLASVGSTAAFVGLFGTVWGIMNSFQAIAQSKNTSLAVVAPGIAEALFATAIGLVVAIPAVVGYNRLSGRIESYGAQLDLFAQQIVAWCMRI